MATFHRLHEEIFAVSDPDSAIEFVGWTATVSARIRQEKTPRLDEHATGRGDHFRSVYFPRHGSVETAVRRFELLPVGEAVAGPAIIESSFTTVVVDPGAIAVRRQSGSLSIDPN